MRKQTNPSNNGEIRTSRRPFLKSIAGALATTVGIPVFASRKAASSVNPPEVPNRFSGDEWEHQPLESSTYDDFTWSGFSLENTELRATVEEEAEVSFPIWRLYSWTLDVPFSSTQNNSGSGSSGNGVIDAIIDSMSISLGPAQINLGRLGDEYDGVTSRRAQLAMSIYGSQLESDFPITKGYACEGLNEEEWSEKHCWNTKEISFNSPQSTVEEKHTIIATHEDNDGNEVSYRGFFVLHTFNKTDSMYTISGTMFPDGPIDTGWISNYEFNTDFVGLSREFIKNAGER